MIYFGEYLTFSDGAKYADIARNIYLGNGLGSNFHFWNSDLFNNLINGYFSTLNISPAMPFFINILFNIFGVSDMAVKASSIVCYLLTLLVVYLLSNILTKNKFISSMSVVAVAFNINLLEYSLSGATEPLFIFGVLLTALLLSSNNKLINYISLSVAVLVFFTRPQSVVYLIILLFYFLILKMKFPKGVVYWLVVSAILSMGYLQYSSQGINAITQNLPGVAVSDSLRGNVVGFDALIIFKKIFYNLYNFYKAIPDIFNPYLFALFILGMFSWGKNKLLNSFKISSLFMVLATLFITAVTIPFYRYIHPVIPFIYIIGVVTLFEIIEYFVSKYEVLKNKRIVTNIIVSTLVLFYAVGQTIGILVLDSRFERKTKNVDKPPIYVLMSWKLKEITNKDAVIVTNLDTWGSWYGERKTIWFPLEPQMILEHKDRIDAIYLTSYKMDDENYYMGEQWREIFENPEKQTILPDYKYVGAYEFKSEDNYDKEKGRSILLVRN